MGSRSTPCSGSKACSILRCSRVFQDSSPSCGVAHDSQRHLYRGVYEWDGATLADDYVRTLWRVLAFVCWPGSIHYEIVPGLTREELLRDPATLDGRALARTREALRLIAAEQLPRSRKR